MMTQVTARNISIMEAASNEIIAEAEHATASACRVADLLLDIGTVLLVSGAHCGRITRNIERVSQRWGYNMELFITFTGIMVSIKNIANPSERVARFRHTGLHGVHFGVLTEISLLTWKVVEENLSIEQVEKRLAEIKKLPHHSRWQILLGIGTACACLCILAEGNWKNAGMAFIAAVCGMYARQEVLKMRFNP
ncbi:MAG: threonine/serine exporter family protein, partial [Gloeobacteraceae cyanobacterium ES-bin-144]|nr:threonine/serine exporter family protein [Verrucomicrobiales bacterium]